MRFLDRKNAGEMLAQVVAKLKFSNPIVFGLARGGVPIAFEVAKILRAPLDVVIVRKLSTQDNPEFAIGAIAPEGFVEINHESVASAKITEDELNKIIKNEQTELLRRLRIYRGTKQFPIIENKDIILVDDGIATGTSAKVAINFLKSYNPKTIFLASPVCSQDSQKMLQSKVDKVICLMSPPYFSAVGEWYESFDQVSDEEVISFLNKH